MFIKLSILFLAIQLAFANDIKIIDSLKVNQSLSILNACKNHYNDKTKIGKFFASNRNIYEQIMMASIDCNKDQIIQISNRELSSFLASLDQISSKTKNQLLLYKLNLQSINDAIYAFLLNHALYNNDNFLHTSALSEDLINSIDEFFPNQVDKKQQKEIIANIITRLKKEEVKKQNQLHLINHFKNFGNNINSFCTNLRKEVLNDIGKRPIGRVASSNRQGKSKISIYDAKLQKKMKHAQKKLSSKLFAFSKHIKKPFTLLYSDEFRDIFPINQKLTEKCAKGKLSSPVRLNEISQSSLKLAIKDLNSSIKEDIDDTSLAIQNHNSNDVRRIDYSISKYLKYKPYLFGKILSDENIQDENKKHYAKYICHQTNQIYKIDELWNKGALAGGVTLGVLSGGLAASFGLGILGTIAAGTAASAVDGSIVAYREYEVSQDIIRGSTIELMANRINSEQYNKNENIAEDRKFTAALSLAAIPASAIIGTAAPLLRNTKVITSTSDEITLSSGKTTKEVENTTVLGGRRDPISEKALKYYSDQLAKPNGAFDRINRLTERIRSPRFFKNRQYGDKKISIFSEEFKTIFFKFKAPTNKKMIHHMQSVWKSMSNVKGYENFVNGMLKDAANIMVEFPSMMKGKMYLNGRLLEPTRANVIKYLESAEDVYPLPRNIFYKVIQKRMKKAGLKKIGQTKQFRNDSVVDSDIFRDNFFAGNEIFFDYGMKTPVKTRKYPMPDGTEKKVIIKFGERFVKRPEDGGFDTVVTEGALNHGGDSHLLQILYVSEKLERDLGKGATKELLEYYNKNHVDDTWEYYFDAGPGLGSLNNPGLFGELMNDFFDVR